MIKLIVDIVKILAETATKISAMKKESTAQADKLELLKIFFILKDVQEDGSKLLELASPSPSEYLKNASKEAAELRIKIWDAALRRQGARLYELNSFISNRSDLCVIDLKAQRRMKLIIGSKHDRILNLFELGSGLFFRTVLPINESPETLAELVTHTLQLNENKALDTHQIRLELDELDKALDEYGNIISMLMSSEEIRSLSEKAREATKLQ